ncbi:hypothetical protein EX30DRAFT_397055 [Ascodesmis nigricans]|uniref:C2H2-type domain-containing protein n=1 Tax=Ascodesmis nigricans TaxID=341454 RepID=A0A4S2MQG6_9PEZI|nr:hypothetical protein EX30DRAFT_397055 [Ascodesmis nigricans]
MAVSLSHHSTPEHNWFFPDLSCVPVPTAEFYFPSCASSETSSDYSSPFHNIDWPYIEPWQQHESLSTTATDASTVSPALSQVDYYSSREEYPPFSSATAISHHAINSIPTPLPSPGITHSEPRTFHCQWPSCTAAPADRIFTRKSDWRRHNDKHTRPYKCPHASCADLPGFSWPGGLNRHVEEQHTAASQRHRCPHTDCKRHEKGFNRYWNLKNHIKKVHNKKGKDISASTAVDMRRMERAESEARREQSR